MNVHRAVDGQRAVFQVNSGGRIVRGRLGVAAGGAAIGADMVVVDVVVGHRGVTDGAVGAVVIHAGGGGQVDGAVVQTEPLHLFVALGEAGGQGVVGVQNQLRVRMDGGQDGVVDPLRMAVAGELVPVEVGDDELRGVEELEAELGVPLVTLQQQHVSLDFTAKGGVGQHQGGDALDLVGAFLVVDHVLAVRPENGGDHLHGGGLAVAARDGDDVGRKLHPAQDVRADF